MKMEMQYIMDLLQQYMIKIITYVQCGVKKIEETF